MSRAAARTRWRWSRPVIRSLMETIWFTTTSLLAAQCPRSAERPLCLLIGLARGGGVGFHGGGPVPPRLAFDDKKPRSPPSPVPGAASIPGTAVLARRFRFEQTESKGAEDARRNDSSHLLITRGKNSSPSSPKTPAPRRSCLTTRVWQLACSWPATARWQERRTRRLHSPKKRTRKPGLSQPPPRPTSCLTTRSMCSRPSPRTTTGSIWRARYNYENLETGSVWVGYNLSGGEKLEWELTPMLGGVFGNTTRHRSGLRGFA